MAVSNKFWKYLCNNSNEWLNTFRSIHWLTILGLPANNLTTMLSNPSSAVDLGGYKICFLSTWCIISKPLPFTRAPINGFLTKLRVGVSCSLPAFVKLFLQTHSLNHSSTNLVFPSWSVLNFLFFLFTEWNRHLCVTQRLILVRRHFLCLVLGDLT